MKVIITGVSGQTGSYMVDYLLDNFSDIVIYGVLNPLSKHRHDPRIKNISLDITDKEGIENLIDTVKPDYFFNFAADTFAGSQNQIHDEVNYIPVIHQLQAILDFAPECRYFNAGSSDEIYSSSTYAFSKRNARRAVLHYRNNCYLYALQGTLYNHESERRGEQFVTRKITLGVGRILNEKNNHQKISPIEVGNLDSERDWSHAYDFVDGIWKMMNQENFRKDLSSHHVTRNVKTASYWSKYIKEYSFCSGKKHTIRQFIEQAFRAASIEGIWWNPTGKPEDEIFILAENGIATKSRVDLVVVNPKFYRVIEPTPDSDYSEAFEDLGWSPKITIQELIELMVSNDL